MNSTYKKFGILILISLLANISKASTPNEIVGRWVSEKQSRGGMRGVIKYTNDGKFISRMVVMTESKYIRKGKKLTVLNEDGTKSHAFKIKLKKNELQIKQSKKGKWIHLQRFGESPSSKDNDLVGGWCGDEPNGGTSCYIFLEDGVLLYQRPMPGETELQYKIKGNLIEVLQTVNSFPDYFSCSDLSLNFSNKT